MKAAKPLKLCCNFTYFVCRQIGKGKNKAELVAVSEFALLCKRLVLWWHLLCKLHTQSAFSMMPSSSIHLPNCMFEAPGILCSCPHHDLFVIAACRSRMPQTSWVPPHSGKHNVTVVTAGCTGMPQTFWPLHCFQYNAAVVLARVACEFQTSRVPPHSLEHYVWVISGSFWKILEQITAGVSEVAASRICRN